MDARRESEPAPMKNRTTVERKSERELVVTRTVDAPARIVFEAWTKPELFKRWWVPKSLGMTLLSCEMDVRVGGRYRLEFAHGDSQAAFFGTYQEVTPHSRLVWTNEESDEGCRHHRDLRGKRRQDVAGHARALSLEGSSRRRGHRGGGCDGRDVRATGRVARHSGGVEGDEKEHKPVAEQYEEDCRGERGGLQHPHSCRARRTQPPSRSTSRQRWSLAGCRSVHSPDFAS